MLVGLAKKEVMVAVRPFILFVSIYSDDASPYMDFWLFLYRYLNHNIDGETSILRQQPSSLLKLKTPTA